MISPKQSSNLITPLLLMFSIPSFATVMLFDSAFNIDGTTLSASDPVINTNAFDSISGLGSIDVTISSAGVHTFDVFFDHEIDEPINTFFNENGAFFGVASVGQSWEIDEPGTTGGNIFDNFLASTLDNSIGGLVTFPDDVSMALGWDFTLGVGEAAFINLLLDVIAPTNGFYLVHSDPDSNKSIYLSSELRIETNTISEPGILGLLLIGIAAISVGMRRKSSRYTNCG